MPGMAPPGMPTPGMSPPGMPTPGNAPPMAAPQQHQGNMAQAMLQVKQGLELLQKALPMLPMGSPEHTDVMQAIAKLSKHVSKGQESGQDKGMQIQNLLQMIQAAKSAPNPAIAKMGGMPGPNAPPAVGGAAPPSPAA